MEKELLKEAQERAKEKARKNIENFLKELNELEKKDPYIKDPFEDKYRYKTYEGEAVRILDEYDKRKNQAREKLRALRKEARIEARNGYTNLSKKEQYEICSERRRETEKIVIDACLGPRYAKTLIVACVNKLYNKIYNINNPNKSTKKRGIVKI